MNKKICTAFCSIIISFFCVVPVVCASVKASAYLSSYRAYGYDEGSGTVSIWYEVVGTETMDEIGVKSIRLQEKAPNATTWTEVNFYSYTEYPAMMCYDDFTHSGFIRYNGIEGYSYRAYVTFWAGKDGGGDARTVITDPVP